MSSTEFNRGDDVPRSRIQERMRQAAEDSYWDVVRDIEDASDRLEDGINEMVTCYEFQGLLTTWMALIDELSVAERELSRCVDPNELPKIGMMFGDYRRKFDEVKDKACQHLDTLMEDLQRQEEVDRSETFEASESRDEQVSMLLDRVRRLENELEMRNSTEPRSDRTTGPLLPREYLQPSVSSRDVSTRDMENQNANCNRGGGDIFERDRPDYTRNSEGSDSRSSSNPVTGNDFVASLAGALENMRKQDRLPKVQPPVFKGDILSFPSWLNSFQTLIEREVEDPFSRLAYLEQYTGEKVHKALLPYFRMYDDPDAYDKAKGFMLDRYGDKIKISEAYRQKLRAWPQIRKGDVFGLREYADFLHQCRSSVKSIGFLSSLDSAEENVKLAGKLPHHLGERWNRIVVEKLYRDTDASRVHTEDYPTFDQFCTFVMKEARIADGPCTRGQERVENNQQHLHFRSHRAVNHRVEANPRQGGGDHPDPPRDVKCFFCKGSHYLSQCTSFLAQPYEKKKEFAVQYNLCFGCLRKGHGSRFCRHKDPKLMNRPVDSENKAATSASVSLKTEIRRDTPSVTSMVVPVIVTSKDTGKQLATYALLDSQSDGCFLREDVMERLEAPNEEIQLKLTTMGSSCEVKSHTVENLTVRGFSETETVDLPECYTRGEIPFSPECIPRPSEVRRWSHLESLSDQLLPYNEEWGVGLLLGFNCSHALIPKEVLVGENIGDPYGIRTPLGWSVVGKVGGQKTGMYGSFCHRTSARPVTMERVREAFDMEFQSKPGDEEMASVEDDLFMRKMQSEARQLPDGHIELPLPLRSTTPTLPNSRRVAERRLESLRRRLIRDTSFRTKYVKFITDMISKGHAEMVPAGEKTPERVWYLPHQGVDHPRKPDVVRVVFDGSAECEGINLNSLLMAGPDLNNLLIGVLMRFRKEKIALTCDIEGMFLQVRVREEDRDMLRFLWFQDNDPTKPIVEYRVCVHLFGATSSPACATYALRKTADMYQREFPEVVVEFIKKFFYVDDGVKSVGSKEEAWEIIEGSRKLCSKGGFNLQKFVCNDKEVMRKIPVEWRAKNADPDTMFEPSSPLLSILGVGWCVHDDTLRYELKTVESCTTRRAMLSFIGTLYDPMGLIAPLILPGRLILQELCKSGTTWDQKVSEEEQGKWDCWMNELVKVKDLKVKRCFREKTEGKVRAIVHITCDASNSGYGGCAHLELIDSRKVRDTALLMSKARVRPTKTVTTPRMELQAAVVGVRMKLLLEKELDYEDIEFKFYSDSQIVLAYIQNLLKKLRNYVRNRVQFIIENCGGAPWKYIPTDINPADIASRGATPTELANNPLWLKGPVEFFAEEKPEERYEIQNNDPELTKETRVHAVRSYQKSILPQLRKFSSWTEMVKAVAVLKRCARRLRSLAKKEPIQMPRTPVSLAEMAEAKVVIIRGIQQEEFSDIYTQLKNRKYPELRDEQRGRKQDPEVRRFMRLDAYMDENGLIRVGGRIRRANLPLNWRHPCVLPTKSYVTSALIRYYHAIGGHGGRDRTIAEVRGAGYWILRWRRSLGRELGNCVTCRRVKGRPSNQKMADLPVERLEENAPFTHVGVDMIGPFLIRERRITKKRWVAIFTCMVVRAVHVEVCQDYTASSFINALRRMMARRGSVKTLTSDRGTNIVGARSEMCRGLEGLEEDELKRYLQEQGCEYVKFAQIPPHAPHMGGVWEKMVRSVKTTLALILAQLGEQLTDESLHTFLLEAEAIVNGRPLTVVDASDPEALEPLTPATLLNLKPRGLLPPPGDFGKEAMYARSRWRRVQHVAGEFWNRWKREYLPLLQKRQKWLTEQPNYEVDDIVLIQNLNLPRARWPIARITEVKVSEDGCVRSVKVKTAEGEYTRPISKLILLHSPRRDVVYEERVRPSPSDDDGRDATRRD